MSTAFPRVRATVRSWRHMARTQAAYEAAGWSAYAPLEMPPTLETVTRVWLAGDCGREEGDDGTIVVWRGPDWWRHDPAVGARSNENVPGAEPHRSSFEWLRRTSLDDHTSADLSLPGAEILVERDAERGTVVQIEARHAGEPYAILEVLEITFDETFPDDTFVFTPPPGVEVRSILDDTAVRWGLTLEQVAAAAPFALWVAAEDWECTIAYAREETDPSIAPQVHLQYSTTGTRIAQSPVSHPGQQARIVLEGAGPWRDTERNGRHMEVREHAEVGRPTQVCLELEGTWIEIHSWELDVNALADLAGGLRRAP